MPIFLTNDKFRGLLRGAWISSPADTSLLVNSIPANVPSILVAGYGTDNETVFSFTGTSGTNASNYVLTGVTRLRGANVNLPENTTLHSIAVEEFFNQYAGVASTASGIATLIYGVDSESGDAYEISLDTSPGSYTAGLSLLFKANTTNTGASTIDVNGLGVKDIKKYGQSGLSALEDGDIQSGQIVNIVYDGTQFLLMNHSTKVSAVTTASSATPSPTGSAKNNELYVTALAAAAELQAPSGTPANGNKLLVRIKDNGTARALTYNAIYSGIVASLPSTTVLSKVLYMQFIYNSTSSKWEMVGIAEEE